MLAALAAAALAPTAFGGVAEIRDAQGHLTADAGAVGTYASAQDGGWALRFNSATRSSRGVTLTGVSLAGGAIYAERVYVPAHGLRGARVVGLTVNGKPVAATPNSLVPLGPTSYLVVLQEAVVPGEGSGIVGLRLVAGDSSLGLDPGSQVLVGLARAALPATHRSHHSARLSWLALGCDGPRRRHRLRRPRASGPALARHSGERRLGRRPGGADRDAVPRRALRLGRRRPAHRLRLLGPRDVRLRAARHPAHPLHRLAVLRGRARTAVGAPARATSSSSSRARAARSTRGCTSATAASSRRRTPATWSRSRRSPQPGYAFGFVGAVRPFGA